MLVLLAITAIVAPLATAQNGNCGALNTNNNCQLGALPQDSTTIYYSPSDSSDIQFFGQAEGSCDSGTYADVTFNTGFDAGGTQLVDCGCLLLDGNTHLLDCPGIAKNSLAEGGYHFVIQLNANYAGLDRFSITHTQQTATAATPTSTVTTYTTQTTETTTTVTSTNTATSAQTTITDPAATFDTTQTITPSPVTSTSTKTRTRTYVQDIIVVVQKTITQTAPCTTPPMPTCMVQQKGPRHPHQIRGFEDALQVRAETAGNGYTVSDGDGPLTTTVTPSGVVVTETDDGGTVTSTDTVYTTTTTTIQPTPLTTTVFFGTLTDQFVTTLAPVTSTVTTHTVTKTTITYVFTVPWYHFTRTTPVCSPTARKNVKGGH
ncbi:hypothetical protein ANO11243_042240 [Dothideomycetidae sp. 11243]|nr:hypothetical protein ANO11243_042240 [fungal sp. No.11243]